MNDERKDTIKTGSPDGAMLQTRLIARCETGCSGKAARRTIPSATV